MVHVRKIHIDMIHPSLSDEATALTGQKREELSFLFTHPVTTAYDGECAHLIDTPNADGCRYYVDGFSRWMLLGGLARRAFLLDGHVAIIR